MTKSKKHSPMQTETEPSIISQVPKETMKDFIEGLVALAQAKQGSQSQDQEASSQEEPIRQTIPSEAVLQKFLKSED